MVLLDGYGQGLMRDGGVEESSAGLADDLGVRYWRMRADDELAVVRY